MAVYPAQQQPEHPHPGEPPASARVVYEPHIPNPAPQPDRFGDGAVNPEAPPFAVIEPPPHISNEKWQTSYYDASSHAPMGKYVQKPSGPCDPATGQLLDGDWPASRGPWRQV